MNLTSEGQFSPDGMWQWDGQEWRPTDKQLAPPATSQGLEMVSSVDTPGSLLGYEAIDRRAAKAARKEQAAAAKDEDRRRVAAEREARAFANSPVGRARVAFERGDAVFQYSIDVMSQQAIIVSMIGSATSKSVSDPSEILNAVCREGWELVNGSFVFVEEGQQSRDKFMSSGQNVAVKGTTFGYYLFKRNPEMRSTQGLATLPG